MGAGVRNSYLQRKGLLTRQGRLESRSDSAFHVQEGTNDAKIGSGWGTVKFQRDKNDYFHGIKPLTEESETDSRRVTRGNLRPIAWWFLNPVSPRYSAAEWRLRFTGTFIQHQNLHLRVCFLHQIRDQPAEWSSDFNLHKMFLIGFNLIREEQNLGAGARTSYPKDSNADQGDAERMFPYTSPLTYLTVIRALTWYLCPLSRFHFVTSHFLFRSLPDIFSSNFQRYLSTNGSISSDKTPFSTAPKQKVEPERLFQETLKSKPLSFCYSPERQSERGFTSRHKCQTRWCWGRHISNGLNLY